MVAYWEPGTQYNLGDVVEYEGNFYKIIQAHRSQSDWAPPIVPALWGRVHQHDVYNQSNQQQHQQQPQWQPPPQQQPHPPPQQPQQPMYNYGNDGMQQGYASPDQKPEHHEHGSKPWNFIEEHKGALGLAAGVIGGLGVLGGAAALYKKHEHDEKEEREFRDWVQRAQSSTEQFYRNGPRAPYTWVLAHGKNIPQGAIVVDKEHDWLLHICRAYYDHGIQVGKASSAFKKGAVIGYQKDEHHLDTYEILLGDMNGLRWVPTSGRLNVSSLGYRPVEGGRENDGTPLYVAKAQHKGVYHPGKASEKLDGAYIPYDDSEKNVRDYYVLCTNHP